MKSNSVLWVLSYKALYQKFAQIYPDLIDCFPYHLKMDNIEAVYPTFETFKKLSLVRWLSK